MITGWSDPRHNTLHRRALELQPAIAAAAMNDDTAGSQILYDEYLATARLLGVGARDAWMVYGVASVNWPLLLIAERAQRDGIDQAQAACNTILATKNWVEASG